MNNFPQKVEGRGVSEVIPGVFWAERPTAETSFANGERVGFPDFLTVAQDIDVPDVHAARAFNSVFAWQRHLAFRLGIIDNPVYYSSRTRPSWDYMLHSGNYDTAKRTHILLATQAVYDYYQASIRETAGIPTIKSLRVMESLLGLDEVHEADLSAIIVESSENQ